MSDHGQVPSDEVEDVFAQMAGRRRDAPDKPPRERRQPIDRINDLEDAVTELGKQVPVGRLQRLEDGLAALKARVAALERPAPDPKDPPVPTPPAKPT